MNPPPITRVALCVRDIPGISGFYQKHFGFVTVPPELDDKITLASPSGGCSLVILQASKGHRIGQSCVKLVFDVADVADYKKQKAAGGLLFGTIHRGPGYEFANARDPAKNLIQISNSHLPPIQPGKTPSHP